MYSRGLRPTAVDTGEINGEETQSSVPSSTSLYFSGLASNWK